MITLRPYQQNAIDEVIAHLKQGKKRILLQASTGAGKTIIASSIIERATAKGNYSLFVAHRKEIITQTSSKLDDFGIDHGIIMGSHERVNLDAQVQVGSIQTLTRRDKPRANLIIIDETHLACGESYQKLIEHYPDAVIIGLTATPVRLDGRGLGEIYEDIVEVIPMQQLIADGHLVKPKVFMPFVPNMKGIKTERGDYDQNQIAELMDKPSVTGDIVKYWQEYATGRKTIAFASSVAHSKSIAEAFNDAGISARHLDATTPASERDKVLQDWREGAFDVLSNMGLFVEGLDVPAASCCILARPTKSVTIYLQAVGRVMRPAIDKQDCIILDHAGLTHKHGLIHQQRKWSLAGKPKQEAKEEDEKVHACKSCFAVYDRKEHPLECPECGYLEPKRVVEIIHDGKLVELTPELEAEILARSEKARKGAELKAAKTIDQLIELGIKREYKNPKKWAQHIMDSRRKWAQDKGYAPRQYTTTNLNHQ